MSRIGKLPITIPAGVTVSNQNNLIKVKGVFEGKPVELQQLIDKDIVVKIEDNTIKVERLTEMKKDKSLHGLYRSLIDNMIEGVSKGYEVKLELVGVGYKATSKGQLLDLSLGFSHTILFELPEEIQVEATTERRANPVVVLKSYDKQLIGQIAAKIRSLRPPEPYKGKGIKFVGEELRRKAGKAAAAS